MKKLNIIILFISLLTFKISSISSAEKAGGSSLSASDQSSINNVLTNMLSADESKTISIIMQTMLPSMFGLFSNITSEDFKANFKEPCRFDSLLDIFSKLPPYFDIIAAKYPLKPDLAAYYSMQLASTFLVNNGSLTMSCLYNMLSLQTRLMKFSLNIMDNPEENPELVGKFGIFMKPVMSMLKKNAMMKIIDHVDQYDKNDDLNTVNLFNLLNFFYCLVGVFGILSNILLVILLRRSSIRHNKKKIEAKKLQLANKNKQNIYETRKSSLKQQQSMQLEPLTLQSNYANVTSITTGSLKKKKAGSELVRKKSTRKNRHRKKKEKSEYDMVKSVNNQFNRIIRKRYKTRLCFIIIAICHSLYILFNFIVMSQAGLAAVALQGLSKLNIACKISFFLFPPTTAYNLLHQLSIWLLFYAIMKHSRKLRNTMTHNFDRHADYDVNLMTTDTESCSDFSSDDDNDESSSDSSDENIKRKSHSHNHHNAYDSLNDDEPDTISQSLTNNSSTINQQNSVQPNPNPNNQIAILQTDPFPLNITSPINNKSTVHFVNENGTLASRQQIYSNVVHQPSYYNPIYANRRHPYDPRLIGKKPTSVNPAKTSLLCFLFERKSRNALFSVILFLLLLIYNGQNLFFYSLIELKTAKNEIITYCAFEEAYSEYYNILNQYIVPLLNLFLFSIIPLFLCTMQVLFDACFLIRVQREQTKRYEKLREIIEWPLYSYYLVYIVSQLPFAMHQVSDLIVGTIKFPFVFPIFIQMKFTSKVWLVIFEMTLMIFAYSSDLFIWLICDRHLRQLCKNWLNKRILCRTYSKSSSSSSSGTTSTSSSSSIHSIKHQNRKMKLSSLSGSSNSNGGVSSSNSNSDSNYLTLANDKTNDTTTNDKKSSLINSSNSNQNGLIAKNNYASSTLSSTSSSILNSQNTITKGKKSISPNILESVKASATLSASASFNNNDVFINSTPAANKLPNLNHIRMIDTDNETETEQQPNSPLHQQSPLEKLDEDEEFKKMKPLYSTSSDSQPPSFKSAVTKPQYSNVINAFRHHQYENNLNFNNGNNNTQTTNDK